MYFILEPEVAGGWGDTTIVDTRLHPPVVHKLEYHVEGWLGDDLLASFPCFITTARLRAALDESELTGFQFDDVLVTKSEDFDELQRISSCPVELPTFFWLKVTGKLGRDDFALTTGNELAVSQPALDLLSGFNVKHCNVEELKA